MKNLDRFTEPLIEFGAKLNNFKPSSRRLHACVPAYDFWFDHVDHRQFPILISIDRRNECRNIEYDAWACFDSNDEYRSRLPMHGYWVLLFKIKRL